ncbi:MAG: cell division protein ZapB [Deltaproteobacteria bacterium]|jgi:FtsZ-binding cell division protein ZapB|nr:cell division protein ZapB [Deltaproteobacteria bacterium]
MDLTKLELLETKIAALLEKKAQAEKLARDLKATLDKTRDELTNATEQIKTLSSEREVVLERLDALLGKLDSLETEKA